MLLELMVKDFAIIESLSIQFSEGLNILSGETGAGKSVLLKSLSLLMGEKAQTDLIRTNSDCATVEGLFDISKRDDIQQKLKELDVENPDDQLIVRRIISKGGKSRIYLNGTLSPIASLQEIVAPLLEISSYSTPLIELTTQHENKSLLSRHYHLNVLDRMGSLMGLKTQYSEKFIDLKNLEKEISELENLEKTRVQRLEFLVFQRDEISKVELKSEEEDEIEKKYLKLRHGKRLTDWAQKTESILDGEEESLIVRIHRVLQMTQELYQFDSQLKDKAQILEQAKTLLEEFVFEVRKYSEAIESQPEQLELLENRRSQIRQLQKKYGNSISEILDHLKSVEQEIAKLSDSESTMVSLKKKQSELGVELDSLAEELHKKRSQLALELKVKVNKELENLNMNGVIFSIQIEKLAELNSSGKSQVEFLIQSSKKDNPKPLSKVASGGELSRILLALKSIMGNSELPRTYLFDEVDAGVSGPTAEKVGKKLHLISKGQQVICVTHLPQVAAYADKHFSIAKESVKKGVQMEVLELDESKRVREIARLISGEKISKSSLDHAQSLIKNRSIN